jgi:hypothetical protein
MRADELQGPEGLRALIVLAGEQETCRGGFGLFRGRAAADSAMAAVIGVTDAAKS